MNCVPLPALLAKKPHIVAERAPERCLEVKPFAPQVRAERRAGPR